MFLLVLLSVVCQAEPWTECFIIKLEQKAVFPNLSVSIERDRHTLPDNLSEVFDTNDYAGLDFRSDDKPNRPGSYGVRLPVEVVVAAGWLLESNLTNDFMLFNPIQQQEATSTQTQGDQPFATITMMLRSVDDQQSHQPSESSSQQAPGAPQSTGYFANLLYSDYGGGNRGPQQALHTLGFNCFVSPCRGVCSFRLSSGSRESAEWPLNSAESSTASCRHLIGPGAVSTTDSAEPPNYDVTMLGNLPANSDDWIIIHGLLNLRSHIPPEKTGINCTLTHFKRPMVTSPLGCLPSGGATRCQKVLSDHKSREHFGQPTCDVIVVGKDAQQRPCGKVYRNANSLIAHKRIFHSGQRICVQTVTGGDGQHRPCGKTCKNTQALWDHKLKDHSGQKTCYETVVGADGQPRPCGEVCKNAKTLSSHKRSIHTGQQTCHESVVRKDGQQQPCGKVCKSAKALSDHNRKEHTGQKICNATVAGRDGQQQCGKVCKNAKALSDHKRSNHSGPRTCNETVVGRDGQKKSCGAVCKSVNALTDHKKRNHSGQKICNAIVVGDDGQGRPCERVLKNARSLSCHKSKYHSGQKTSDKTVNEESDQRLPCGLVCKNANALKDHKKSIHSGQQICNLPVIGEDGQQRLCREDGLLRPFGKAFQNTHALSRHKRTHRKRKSFYPNQNDGSRPKEIKANR